MADTTMGTGPQKPGHYTKTSHIGWGMLVTALAELRAQIGHLLGFSFAINLLVLAVPIFMIQVFDRVLASESMETLGVLAVGAVAALLILATLDLIRGRILSRAGAQLERQLTPDLLAYGAESRLGDVGRLRSFLSGPMMAVTLDAPWIPIFLIAVFLLHPFLGWITLGGTLILATMAIASERLTRSDLIEIRRTERSLANIAKQFNDKDGSGKVMGTRKSLRARWAVAHRTLAAQRLRLNDRHQNASVTGRFLRLVLQISLMTAAAALVINDALTPGAMVAASVIAARALSPVERAQETWRALIEARAALGRLIRTDIRPAKERIAPTNRGPAVLDVRKITLKDTQSRETMFTDLSFSISGGEMIGITGPSGVGKSALAKLLVGLGSPTSGRVMLDGHNIAHLTVNEARDDIAYLSQSPQLYHGTIADNISRFGDAELPEVDAAARLAGVEEAILDLPYGYATEVDPEHNTLPRGIVQGILLARTFFANPRLIVMDEPYTFLDNTGIQHLVSSLDHFRHMGSAVVVVSQRPSVLVHCDSVLILDGDGTRMVGRKKQAELRLLENDPAPTLVRTSDKTHKPISVAGE